MRGKPHEESEAERRRELLELLAFLRPARVRGQKRRNPLDHGESAGGTPGLVQDAGAVFAQEQNSRGFGGFIGVLPEPGTVLIAALEGGGHGLAQKPGVESSAALKRSKKLSCGGQQFGRLGDS